MLSVTRRDYSTTAGSNGNAKKSGGEDASLSKDVAKESSKGGEAFKPRRQSQSKILLKFVKLQWHIHHIETLSFSI